MNHKAAERIKQYLKQHGRTCVIYDECMANEQETGQFQDVRSMQDVQMLQETEHLREVQQDQSIQTRNDAQKKSAIQTMQNVQMKRRYTYTNPNMVPPETECVISIGGDGTLIQAARDLVDLHLPMIGIHFGTLGYLAQEREPLEETLDKLMADECEIESRMMLYGSIYRDEEKIADNIALNDIVINRMGPLTVQDFQIRINGNLMNQYRADGMIVCTPTGSTAYNLSAGGPIVEPQAEILLLTPICAHTLNSRSIVLPPDALIEIQLCGHGGRESGCGVSFDGSDLIEVRKGDCIRIRKSQKITKMIKLGNSSFMETLRYKMRDV